MTKIYFVSVPNKEEWEQTTPETFIDRLINPPSNGWVDHWVNEEDGVLKYYLETIDDD